MHQDLKKDDIMKNRFKKLFRILFLLISAIVFLFVFLPEKCYPKKGSQKGSVAETKQRRMLKNRVYYSRENSADEADFEDFEEF